MQDGILSGNGPIVTGAGRGIVMLVDAALQADPQDPATAPKEPNRAGAPRSFGPRLPTSMLRLLGVLAEAHDGRSLTQLSAALKMPKTSVWNLLRPLVAEGFLLHTDGSYTLGGAAFHLAASVLGTWNLPRLIHPYLQQLCDRTGETALLSVLNRETDVQSYLEIINSPHPIGYYIPVSTTRPLYASAAGRLLLAYADEPYRREYLANVKFKVGTARPITDAFLRDELEKIREEGVSISIDVYAKGLSAVAAPVFGARGVCVAAVNVAGPTDRFTNEIKTLKDTLLEIAGEMSGLARLRS